MSSQLDILALEPYFGGVRRHMLETLVRCSRHRWTVLKLPPRRMERRLSAAANWFSEQLSRHWVGRVDLLFTSEAMNLASLFQLMPALLRHPSVVYFHDNQLPDLSTLSEDPLDLVNLNTAMAATELWFNSSYHKLTFMVRAGVVVDRHSDLRSRNPIRSITDKARSMAPPVDTASVLEMGSSESTIRDPAAVFVQTHDADIPFLNDALSSLRDGAVRITLAVLGPTKGLDPAFPQIRVSETDDRAQIIAMRGCGVVLSVKPDATSDYQVIRAVAAGCRPVLPDGGAYPEIVPESLHSSCLYDITPESLADRIAAAVRPNHRWQLEDSRAIFRPFDAISACRAIDGRVEQLVAGNIARMQAS